MLIIPLPPAAFKVTPKLDIFNTQQTIDERHRLSQKCLQIAYHIFSAIIFPLGIARLIVGCVHFSRKTFGQSPNIKPLH